MKGIPEEWDKIRPALDDRVAEPHTRRLPGSSTLQIPSPREESFEGDDCLRARPRHPKKLQPPSLSHRVLYSLTSLRVTVDKTRVGLARRRNDLPMNRLLGFL